jgi:hypothetical protein
VAVPGFSAQGRPVPEHGLARGRAGAGDCLHPLGERRRLGPGLRPLGCSAVRRVRERGGEAARGVATWQLGWPDGGRLQTPCVRAAGLGVAVVGADANRVTLIGAFCCGAGSIDACVANVGGSLGRWWNATSFGCDRCVATLVWSVIAQSSASGFVGACTTCMVWAAASVETCSGMCGPTLPPLSHAGAAVRHRRRSAGKAGPYLRPAAWGQVRTAARIAGASRTVSVVYRMNFLYCDSEVCGGGRSGDRGVGDPGALVDIPRKVVRAERWPILK